ncbi:MAG: hypothetical protein Q9198_009876, partial [Flavoplaca austrocitrina]
ATHKAWPNLGPVRRLSWASMAGIKRKQSASSGIPRDNVKKRKQGGDPAVESSASSNPEAETDSDPIIESDTTEHSGDDDGVSWPSDDEQMQEENGEKTGLPDKSHANGHKSTAPAATTNGVSNSLKESHAKQKALAQERKAAKPNADSIARSKKLWERLRRKSHVPLEERKKQRKRFRAQA